MLRSLVGSEMCIRDRYQRRVRGSSLCNNMPSTAAIAGAIGGIGIQIFSNAARKVPLGRNPWMHVTLAAVGGFCGGKYTEWEAYENRALDEVAADFEKRKAMLHRN
eukprot:TRINITY_DN1266_c0_g1_i5.p3 TRINITY_DN1266_c0_g1~~TRINITY_DN1266_c0_g1_i5.p3  ORF type:complete len:106 (+),score=38.94 TRINITY_DN1266_c0_g1_i5:98-415(+)